uniref:LAGLIDADG homing endonuclease n=1 Tax=Elmerina hispida TaxID=1245649 RepID=UPI0030027DFB
CGKIYVKEGNQMYIRVNNLSHLVNIIIPFYEQHSLYGAKHVDFLDFKKGVTLVESKLHLTLDGLEELKLISSRMNSLRKF